MKLFINIFLVIAVFSLQAVGQGITVAKTPSVSILTKNIVPQFLAFWDEAANLDEAARVRLFRKQILDVYPDLYADNIVGLRANAKSEDEYNRNIADQLNRVAKLIPAIRMLNTRLSDELSRYALQFQSEFPDYKPVTPVYFMVSLGAFDGAVRDVRGHSALLFGADVVARIYGPDANLAILFDHELFHQYHKQFSDGEGPLWTSLWEEGLAVYVSWRMNPDATVDAVFLNTALARAATPEILPTLAARFRKDMDSTDKNIYAMYFLGNHTVEGFPARSGYYLGFEVANILGRKLSLKELSHLNGDALKQEILAALI